MGTQPKGAIRAGLRAARRERRGAGVAVLGRALLVGAIAAVLLVAADRLLVLNLTWIVLVAGPMGAAAIGALLWSGRRPARAIHGAALIDASLATHDRIRNAIALGDDPGGEDHTFARLAIEEGERVAREADIARAAPIRLGWTWLAWPVVGAIAVLGGLLLPYRVVDGGAEAPVTLAERTEAAEQVEEALQAIREAAAQEPSLENASTEDLARLAEIESQLSDGLITPEEARAETASTLERTAEALEEESLRRELERDAFEELTRELEAGDEALSKELAERLRSGDFEQASEAARELLKQSESMSPEERERLAGELESLSEQLETAAKNNAAREQPAQPPEAGKPSEASGEQDREPTPPGADPRSPQEQLERRQEAQDRAREDAERLSEALRRSAEEARKDPERRAPEQQAPRESAPESGQREQEPGAEGERSESGEQEQREAEGESREGQAREGEQGGEQPRSGGEPQEQPGQGDGEQEPKRPEPSEGETPSDGQPGEQPREGEQTEGQPTQGQQPQGQETEGQAPGEGEGGEQSPGAQPGERPGEQGQRPRPGQGEPTTPGEQGSPESLDEQLRRMGEQESQGERQRERAEDLRQRARRLMGEPEGEGGGPLAGEQELARSPEAPAPLDASPTTPVDARNTPEGEQANEQVIGDWYSDETLARDPAARREAGQRVREAKAGAERAIEQQRVPRRRREFLRRVYERYAESTDADGGGLSPAGQDAGSGGDPP